MDAGAARVAVVTGASSGIGKAAAKALAVAGWRVIGLGRDPDRSAAAAREIGAIAMAPVDMILADLADLDEAARAAREIAALTDRIDVLIDNAGGVAAERRVTAQGNEATFAGNHLGPFLLTDRLLPSLRAAAAQAAPGATRVIVTSSLAHERAPGFDWNDPQMLRRFESTPAYANAKLANLLFARALARRVAADGIVVNAMHPGIVGSNFASHAGADMQAYFRTAQLATPEEGADTLVWLATAHEAGRTTGGYFFKREEIEGSALSRDEDEAERLWSESVRLVAGIH